MQTELLSLSKIFTDNLFRIPDYQRGYSWGAKQLKDFWADLEQLETEKNHYTGVLTLEEVGQSDYAKWDADTWIIESRRFKPYYVVDGQQRLTTSIVLLQCILETLEEDGVLNFTPKTRIRDRFIFETKDGGISRSYIFGYEKDNPSYEFLKTHIYGEHSDSHSTGEETIYTKNLAFAKTFFQQRLSGMTNVQTAELYTKLTQRFLFNIYTISRDIDVFVAFETMNNRGKPLSNLELLKNRLIYLSTKFEVEPHEKTTLRKVINEAWKTVYHYLGKQKNRPLDDDFFLGTHFILYFGGQLLEDGTDPDFMSWKYRRDEYYKDYLLEKIFTSRNLPLEKDVSGPAKLTVDAVFKYANDLSRTVVAFHDVLNPQDAKVSDDEKVLLEKIQRLQLQQSAAFTSTVLLEEKSSKKRIDLLLTLERLMFFATIKPYFSNFEILNLDFAAIKLRAKKDSVEVIINSVDAALPSILSEIDLGMSMAQWANRHGYYGWRGIRYFFFEYEQFVKAKVKAKRDKLVWEDFASENYEEDFVSVEHIYPQKAKSAEWPNFKMYDANERTILKNSLGNLLPLSKARNSSLGNKAFALKRGSKEAKTGYAYGCYSEIEVAHEDDWDAPRILIRGIRLINFMEDQWNVDLGTINEKITLLGLDFVPVKQPNVLDELKKYETKSEKGKK